MATGEQNPGTTHMGAFLKVPNHRFFFPLAFVVTLLSTIALFQFGKGELTPQLWISAVAVVLSYWACSFTADKLRLDLFDKRFEIYTKTLEFCGIVAEHGSLSVRLRLLYSSAISRAP